jgi:hypothetical protein
MLRTASVFQEGVKKGGLVAPATCRFPAVEHAVAIVFLYPPSLNPIL